MSKISSWGKTSAKLLKLSKFGTSITISQLSSKPVRKKFAFISEGMSEEKLHVCGECQKDFNKLHKLKAHMSSHLFKCAKCEKMFFKQIYLRRHVEIHKGNVFQCDQCDFRTSMKIYLQRHSEIHKESVFHCPLCDFQTTRSIYLTRHHYTHTKEKNI